MHWREWQGKDTPTEKEKAGGIKPEKNVPTKKRTFEKWRPEIRRGNLGEKAETGRVQQSKVKKWGKTSAAAPTGAHPSDGQRLKCKQKNGKKTAGKLDGGANGEVRK